MKKLSLLLLIFLVSCAPTIQFIDRETVLETEALGTWPGLEEEMLLEVKKMGPTPLKQSSGQYSQDPLRQINGQLINWPKVN